MGLGGTAMIHISCTVVVNLHYISSHQINGIDSSLFSTLKGYTIHYINGASDDLLVFVDCLCAFVQLAGHGLFVLFVSGAGFVCFFFSSHSHCIDLYNIRCLLLYSF